MLTTTLKASNTVEGSEDAQIIGEVREDPTRTVIMHTGFGSTRSRNCRPTLSGETVLYISSASLVFWYNPSYTLIMKTAISIPEELFESAEQFARGRGMSRSELYTTALRHYLGEHQGEMVTERLDEIYGAESDGLDPAVSRLQARSLPEDDW